MVQKIESNIKNAIEIINLNRPSYLGELVRQSDDFIDFQADFWYIEISFLTVTGVLDP